MRLICLTMRKAVVFVCPAGVLLTSYFPFKERERYAFARKLHTSSTYQICMALHRDGWSIKRSWILLYNDQYYRLVEFSCSWIQQDTCRSVTRLPHQKAIAWVQILSTMSVQYLYCATLKLLCRFNLEALLIKVHACIYSQNAYSDL